MKEYKRLTRKNEKGEWCVDSNGNGAVSIVSSPYGKYYIGTPIVRLAELEDKIENGTLIFKEKPKTKYYAIVGYRNCYSKFGWHIHYVSIEYEKEHNRVALNIDGRLFVTTKDLLFNTKAEAEKKLAELKGEV